MSTPSLPLVIGIGNPLRRDDGVGWRLAAEWGLLQAAGDRAEILAVQQLLPELADSVARSSRVLFIDATVAGAVAEPGSGPWLQPLPISGSDPGSLTRSHSLDPPLLLALASQLYGRCPGAHRLLLEGRSTGHGTAFSAAMRRQLPAARALMRDWLNETHA